MEHGTEWERRAVRERWAELERQRRAAKRLLGGTFLVLAGLVALLVAVVPEACVEIGPWPHGCTAVVPAIVSAGLFLGGLAAVGAGLRRCWHAL